MFRALADSQPVEIAPRRTRFRRLLRAAIALAAFAGLFIWISNADRLQLDKPISYFGDSLEHMAYEGHGYIRNDVDTRLHAPFELAHQQGWHYVYNALFQSDSNLIWLGSLVAGGNEVEAFNLAYLATYFLAFASAYWVLRRLGLVNPFRFGAASLYALMPYHFQRGVDHFWESCYFLTPLMALLVIRLWSARPIGHRWGTHAWEFDWRDKRLMCALVLIIFFSSFHPYHQFFFACLAASAAPLAALYRRSWRPLVMGLMLAFVATGILVFKSFLLHALADPETILFDINTPTSAYGGAEYYPLKLAQMMLPVHGHRWALLARLRDVYDASNPLNNENSTTTLGLVGSIGLLACIAFAVIPQTELRMSRLRKCGIITLVAILFAMMGGFSSLISTASLVVFGPQFMLTEARGWNRIVIFVAFFAYFAAFWLLQRGMLALQQKRSERRLPRVVVVWPVFLGVFAFALWDQVPMSIAQNRTDHFDSDLRFFASVEALMPGGAQVFQAPYVVHHESGWVLPATYYTDALRPFLATKSLHFTFGGDAGSLQTEWLRRVSDLSASDAGPVLCRYGFSGVLLQRNMLKDDELGKSWTAVLGGAGMRSDDGDFDFYDLRPFCTAKGIAPLDLAAVKRDLVARHHAGLRAAHADELPK